MAQKNRERVRQLWLSVHPVIGLRQIGLRVFLGTATFGAPFAWPFAFAQSSAPEASASTPVAPPSPSVVATGLLPQDLSPWGMFLNADILVRTVMVGLALASLVTWTVWLAKTLELWRAKKKARAALGSLAKARTLAEAGQLMGDRRDAVTSLVRAAALEVRLSADLRNDGLKDRVSWELERIEATASRHIGRGVGILATIGATAPFVGLFGTVWGIMNSFIGISQAHTTNLAVVAPGIAEALLATALGLAAAIPAVVIYNLFTRAIGGYRALLGNASTAVLRLVSRDIDRPYVALARAAE
ncbi:MAG TPA: tonB-system energizer ExbB [Xanthobacteraceae bacterium]|nr:tonB-system energizer ExbB [Xanthobacteraceae bacterium]